MSHNKLELPYCRQMNNRNKKLSNKEILFHLNACPLTKLPPKMHLPKLVCLAIPGILHGTGVSHPFWYHRSFVNR